MSSCEGEKNGQYKGMDGVFQISYSPVRQRDLGFYSGLDILMRVSELEDLHEVLLEDTRQQPRALSLLTLLVSSREAGVIVSWEV